jgi:hypothetical protein
MISRIATAAPNDSRLVPTSFLQPISHRCFFLACILPFLLLATSCRMLPPLSAEATAFHDTIPWTKEQVEGLTVVSLDPHHYAYMSFSKGGYVAVTAGSGGKFTSPLLGWRLIRGRLFFFDPIGKKLGSELYLVSLTNEILTVRRSDGSLATYKVHPTIASE